MVKYKDVQAANRELVRTRDLVCVSAGGTSGIGETTLRQLAATSGSEPNAKSLRIYIIGRKAAVATALIDDLKKSCPKGEFIFVPAIDMALIKDVDKVCDEIMAQEKQRMGEKAKIDLVIQSQGWFGPFEPRGDTAEGLDFKVSLHFYSRIRVIYRLLPLLLARNAGDPPAQIISVYAGGYEKSGKLFTDDLSLRKSNHYGFANARATVVHMKTMVFERFARDYPGKLSLVHVFPGLVFTQAFDALYKPPNPFWLRALAVTMGPIAKRTIATPVPESGQRTMFLATDRFPAYAPDQKTRLTSTASGIPVAKDTEDVLGGGAYSCAVSGETNNVQKVFAQLRPQGFREQVWDHVMDAFSTIEAGKVFDR